MIDLKNKKACQSCGMPMGDKTELYGTNADGGKNDDYCIFCFKSGAFTEEINIEQMIELCVPHMLKKGADFTEESARKMLKKFLPTLKRWKTQ